MELRKNGEYIGGGTVLKVLIVGLKVLDPYLGPSTAVHNILKGFLKIEGDLRKNDLRINFLSMNESKSKTFSEYIEVRGARTRPIPLTSDVQVLLRKPREKFNLIHSHAIFLSNFLQKSEILFNIHGIPWSEMKYCRGLQKVILYTFERMLRLYFPEFTRVIVPSNYCLGELAGKNFDISKVVVVENPVSDRFFELRKREENMILYPAILRPLKNQHGFLRALALVREELRDFDIIFAGGGERNYVDILRKFVKNAGLTNVKFIGAVPYSQMIELYKKASIVSLTSFIESFSMTTIEAMATGTPILASSVGGIPYLVRDGETGLLVDPTNPKEIAEKLLILTSDEALRRRIGEKAKAEAGRRWRADLIARQLLNLYLEVCGEM
ncbi:MAG: glycosyltransferase family 4 protein [Candidatus Bathyarchaeia archaeon]